MLGEYPVEYNKKIHGPYNPCTYYGKKDTPLSEVKLSQLPAWLARRNKSPRAMIAALSRSHWRWQYKYMMSPRYGIAPFVQFAVVTMAFFYTVNYPKYKAHRSQKYHW